MARNAAILAAMVAVAAVASGEAQAQARVEVGVLTCTVRGGAGFIIGSTKDLRCRFNKPGRDEFYHGTISKFGLDIGATKQSAIAWAVFAPTARPAARLAQRQLRRRQRRGHGRPGRRRQRPDRRLQQEHHPPTLERAGAAGPQHRRRRRRAAAARGLLRSCRRRRCAGWSWRTWSLRRWCAVRVPSRIARAAGLHTPEQDRWFFRERLFATCEVWGPRTTRGCSASLPSAKVGSTSSTCCRMQRGGASALGCWLSRKSGSRGCSCGPSSEMRGPAFESRGFVLVEETDGSGNEEQEPDARYLWSRDGLR